MRQRVGIAQALLGDPRLVIVDEPTVGLDPEERVRFRNLLSEIAQGRVVILSTHIVSDVEAVASHIAVIRAGRLVAHATPEALLQAAAGRVFSAVVSSERLAEAQRTGGVHVSNLMRRADGVHVRYVTNGTGATLPAASPVEPDLEDAYLMISLDAAAGARPE
jgi:ABC-type multidrug transport system ATPase subunit